MVIHCNVERSKKFEYSATIFSHDNPLNCSYTKCYIQTCMTGQVKFIILKKIHFSQSQGKKCLSLDTRRKIYSWNTSGNGSVVLKTYSGKFCSV
jgi:hypothetical protein